MNIWLIWTLLIASNETPLNDKLNAHSTLRYNFILIIVQLFAISITFTARVYFPRCTS